MHRRSVVFLLAFPHLITPDCQAGTIGYWRFDEGLPDQPHLDGPWVLDSSPSGNYGVAFGNPIYRPDIPPPPASQASQTNKLSLEFRGGEWIRFQARFPFHEPGDRTLEFWLKFAPSSHQSILWSRLDGFDLNRFNFFVNGNSTFGFDYRSPGGVRHALVGDLDRGIWREYRLVNAAPRKSRDGAKERR